MRAGTSKRNRLFRQPCRNAGLKARSVTVASSRLGAGSLADAKQIAASCGLNVSDSGAQTRRATLRPGEFGSSGKFEGEGFADI
jgi:hypothetical protein